jgi:hypothetical protein
MSEIEEKHFIKKYGEISEDLIMFLLFIRSKFKNFDSAIVFLSIWNSCKGAIIEGVVESDDMSNKSVSKNIQKKLNEIGRIGTNVMGISRETNIPRTTVARIVVDFKKANLVKRHKGNLVVAENLREFNENTRKYLDKFFMCIKEKYK